MEQNTPNKNQVTTTATLSQFEDSPVFNYINNLSPIELLKSLHTDHTLNSLSFASPPAVFASPQLNSQRDIRHQFLDQSKLALPQGKDDNSKRDICDEQSGCFTSGSSAKEIGTEPSGEQLELAIELPKALKYNYASPDGNTVPLDAVRADTGPEMMGNTNERHCSYESDKDLRKICRIKQNEEAVGRDWVTLISDVANVLNFDSSIIDEHPEEQKMADPGMISFISNVLQIPQDSTNTVTDMESTGCVGSSEQGKMGEMGIQSIELEEQKETDQTPTILSGNLLNKLVVNDAIAQADVKGKKCIQSSMQHRIRRRCLIFEMMGAHKKKAVCNSNGSSSTASQSDCEGAHVEKILNPSNGGASNKLYTLSGRTIGLHLNALATTSSDIKIKIDTPASGKQEKNVVPCDNEEKVTESVLQTSMDVGEDFGVSSPKMKRAKLENVGAACKRCNCKRSKCLKLYCECFAAGLYCIEPCMCHDCFNNPAHEDTVLETRKQIESRNPLAFAPKVIRSTDFVSEFGDETNKTPASARHKRGCNCKKSSCLKKYCECFQGGVGCSSNCRCEGCKNTFGSKNEVEENELEHKEPEAHEKSASDVTPHDDTIKNVEEDQPDLPIPSATARSPIQPLITTRGKLSRPLPTGGPSTEICTSQRLGTTYSLCCQPKYGMHLQVIPENETPQILTSNCSTTSGVKSVSPNCKRVSPPHHGFGSPTTWRSGRKLILRSVPRFPSLNSSCEQ